jgi:hypothetical protein
MRQTETLAILRDRLKKKMSVFLPRERVLSEPEKNWKPTISAVRAAVEYAMATERLKWDHAESLEDPTSIDSSIGH